MKKKAAPRKKPAKRKCVKARTASPEDIDPTPESIAAWEKSLPPQVLAEIYATADKENAEMIQQLDKHAKEYEREHPETAP